MRGLMACLRAFWFDHIVRWNGELCMVCGRRYIDTVWWCEDDSLWDAVVQHRVNLICPRCFGRWAEEVFDGFLRWGPQLVLRDRETQLTGRSTDERTTP